jgi:hypothetical protein
LPAVVATQNWKGYLKIFVRNPLSAIGIPILTEGKKAAIYRKKVSLNSS